MIIIRRIHKAGSTNRLAGFGQGFDESFSNYYRDKSKEWVNASEQVRPPPNKYRLAEWPPMSPSSDLLLMGILLGGDKLRTVKLLLKE